jgi:hypothetical protein
MTRTPPKSPSGAIISGLIGIILFLILLIVLRAIANHIHSPFFTGFVDFLYANVVLVILFSILFMLGEVFEARDYPLNLPFPIFKAVGSVLLVAFIIRILVFIDTYFTLGMGSAILVLKIILYPLMFLIVLITGYVSIFSPSKCGKECEEAASPESPQTATPEGAPTWDEIGGEFRQMLHDFFRRIRDEINRK